MSHTTIDKTQCTTAPALSAPIYTWGATDRIKGKSNPHLVSSPGTFKATTGTLEDLARHIGAGYAWMPSLLEPGARRWQSMANHAQLLALDIDDGLTIAQALNHPFIAAHCGLGIESNSSKPEHHKFRLVFPLSQPLGHHTDIKLCTLYLQELVGSADPACKDASRFYYGAEGRQPFILSNEASLPHDFLQQARDWQAAIEAEKAEQRRIAAEKRERERQRIQAAGDVDLVDLVEQAEERLGQDAFIPHLDCESRGTAEKIRCKPAFRQGSGSKSAFIAENGGKWWYHDPASGDKALSGFWFWARVLGKGDHLKGAEWAAAAKEFCALAGIDVPDREWHPSLTAIDGGGKRKKKSKSQRRRERKAIQAREVHHAILHPWGDREVITVHTAAEAIEFLRNHSHVMIDGATGAGKTELIAEFLKYLEKNGKSKSDFFAFTPIRSLARAAAAKFDIPYRGCVHSILAIAPVMLRRDKPIAIFDEVEQNLTALLQSNLCQKDRGQKVALHSQAVQHCERVILASATASNKDVEYFEAITGKTFKILRYAPPIPSKGTLRMYQGDPDVKGSARASKNKVLGSITTRSYVASDSLEVAMRIEKRLTGDIQPGELVPVLACSKTADDDLVKAVISSPRPGDVLAGLGCPGIIATSYVQSGVSFRDPIGVQLFDRVVGVFGGNTIAPSDAFQQLERYRSDIDRHVYAPESAQPPQRLARGFAPKGSSPRSKRVADQWRSDVDSLEAAMQIGAYHDFEFIHGPERDWCQKWEAQMQLEYRNYSAALAAYGLRNGYQVEWKTCTDAAEVQDYRDEVRRDLAAKISNSRPIDYFEFRRLLEKPEPTVTEQDEIEAYLIRDYYGLEWDAPLSIEQVLAEGFGKGRKQLKAAVRSAFAGVAADDDRKHREKLGDSGFVWDATAYELEQRVSDELGLNDILTYCIAGNPRGTHIPQIRDFADRLAAMQDTLGEGSKLFGHAIPWRNPNNPASHYGDTVKWLGMILSNKFGIRSTSTKHRTSEGITTIYTCRQDDIDRLKAAVERKAGSLIDKGFHPRSTPLGKIFTQGIDHPPKMVTYCGMQWYFARRNGENFICVEDADPSDPDEWLLAPQDLAA